MGSDGHYDEAKGTVVRNEPTPKPPLVKEPQAPSDEELEHPCKQTCSGWQQGYERGYRAAQAARAWPSEDEVKDAAGKYWQDDGEDIGLYNARKYFVAGIAWLRARMGEK